MNAQRCLVVISFYWPLLWVWTASHRVRGYIIILNINGSLIIFPSDIWVWFVVGLAPILSRRWCRIPFIFLSIHGWRGSFCIFSDPRLTAVDCVKVIFGSIDDELILVNDFALVEHGRGALWVRGVLLLNRILFGILLLLHMIQDVIPWVGRPIFVVGRIISIGVPVW